MTRHPDNRPRPNIRRRRAAVATTALAAALTVTGLLAGCGSASSGPSITLYSGQHEQTTDGLAAAFEQQTGITVNVRNDDEDTLANLIALQGSHSPADVFYTENSPRLSSCRKRACCPRSTRPPFTRRPPSTTLPRETGSACPPGSA